MDLDHVAIAVPDVEEAAASYCRVLGAPPPEFETVESEGVRIAMIRLGNCRIELLEPHGEGGPISKFLEKRGPGIHHVAMRVDDADAEASRIEGCGARLLGGVRGGSGGSRVAFIHPKSLHGV
ncbi:MAG: methylmalonyl-CoA epimerase, partial [Nitrosopumilus sp.]|nr:methylmalonyl-CoA epimerase [Nitrosopumilus sp.]